MARALLIPKPENATIEELKQVPRIGSNETVTRCTAIQILIMDNATGHRRKATNWQRWHTEDK